MEKRTDTSITQALIQAQEQNNLVSKLINLKPTVNRKPPKSFSHLAAGKVNQRNDKLRKINADNIQMLKKIMGIMQRVPKDKGLDNLQRGFVTSGMASSSMEEMLMMEESHGGAGQDLGAFFNPNWNKQYFTKQENSPHRISNNNGQRRKPQNPFQGEDGRSRDLGEIEASKHQEQSLMEEMDGDDVDYGVDEQPPPSQEQVRQQQMVHHQQEQHHQNQYSPDPFSNDNIVVSSMFDNTQEQSTDSVGFQQQSVSQPQRSTWQGIPSMSILKANTQLIYPGEVSLNHIARKKEVTRINQDNGKLLNRIKEVKSTISTRQQLESYKNAKKFKQLVGRQKPRTVGKSQPRPRIPNNFNQMSASDEEALALVYENSQQNQESRDEESSFLPAVRQAAGRKQRIPPKPPVAGGVFNRNTSQGKRMGLNYVHINRKNPSTSGSHFRPTVNSYSGSQLPKSGDSQKEISTQHATSYEQGEVDFQSASDNYGINRTTANSLNRPNYNKHLQKSPLLAHIMDKKRLPKSIASRLLSERDAKKVEIFNKTNFDVDHSQIVGGVITNTQQYGFGMQVPLSAKHEQRPFSNQNPWSVHQTQRIPSKRSAGHPSFRQHHASSSERQRQQQIAQQSTERQDNARTQYHRGAPREQYSDQNHIDDLVAEQYSNEQPTTTNTEASNREGQQTNSDQLYEEVPITDDLGDTTADQQFRNNNMGFFPSQGGDAPIPVQHNQQYYNEVDESSQGEGQDTVDDNNGIRVISNPFDGQGESQEEVYQGQINQQSSIQSNLDSKVSRNVIAISDQHEGQGETTEENYTEDYYSIPAESKTHTQESKQSTINYSKQTGATDRQKQSKAQTEGLQRDTPQNEGEMTNTEEQYSLPTKSQATTSNQQPPSSLHNIESTNGSKASVVHGAEVTNPGGVAVTTGGGAVSPSASLNQAQRNKVSSYESTRQLEKKQSEKSGKQFTIDASVKSMKNNKLEAVADDDDDGEVGDEYSFEEESVEKPSKSQDEAAAAVKDDEENLSESVKKLTEASIEKEVPGTAVARGVSRQSQETVVTGAAQAQSAFDHSGTVTRLSKNTATSKGASRMSRTSSVEPTK